MLVAVLDWVVRGLGECLQISGCACKCGGLGMMRGWRREKARESKFENSCASVMVNSPRCGGCLAKPPLIGRELG